MLEVELICNFRIFEHTNYNSKWLQTDQNVPGSSLASGVIRNLVNFNLGITPASLNSPL